MSHVRGMLVVRVGVALLLLAGLWFVPWSGVSGRDVFAALRGVSPVWVLVAVMLFCALVPLWALQWAVLARGNSAGWREMFAIAAVSSALSNIVPFLAGEASALVLLVRKAGLERGAALSLLALDALVSGLGKVMLVGLALWLAPLPEWMSASVRPLLLVVCAALLVLWVLARFGRGRLARWTRHLAPLRAGRAFWIVLGLEALKKTIEVVAVLAVMQGCGLAVSVAGAVLVVAALNVVTSVPVTPGNLGVYEACVVLVLQGLGIPAVSASAAAIVLHLAYLAPAIGTGYLIVLARSLRRRV